MEGSINSAFVYDRALSSAEVAARFKQGMKLAPVFCPTTTTTTTATKTTTTVSSTTPAHELIDQLAAKVDKLSGLLDAATAKIGALEKSQALCALQTTTDGSLKDTNSKIDELAASVSEIGTQLKTFTKKVVRTDADKKPCKGDSCTPSITATQGLLFQADGGEVRVRVRVRPALGALARIVRRRGSPPPRPLC